MLCIEIRFCIEVCFLYWNILRVFQYANMATRCYQCDTEFGLISTRNNCVVCGSVLCNKCSSEDLIVFIADSVDVKDSQTRAQLAIIRIVGVGKYIDHFQFNQNCANVWRKYTVKIKYIRLGILLRELLL